MGLKKKIVSCDFCKKHIEVEYDNWMGARECNYLCDECGDKFYPNADIEKEEESESPNITHYHIYFD